MRGRSQRNGYQQVRDLRDDAAQAADKTERDAPFCHFCGVVHVDADVCGPGVWRT